MTDIVTPQPVARRYRKARARQITNLAAMLACVLAVAACLLMPLALRVAGVDLDFACASAAAFCVVPAILGGRQS